MTQDEEVILNAKLCGIDVSNGKSSEVWVIDLKEFAKRFVINEREACAKLMDDMAAQDNVTNYYKVAANAIRARSNQ